MHCFTGSKIFAHKLIDIDCFISISGIITFNKFKGPSRYRIINTNGKTH